MVKLGELVDLYNFFPIRVKKDKNESNDLYWQMLSKKRSLSEIIKRRRSEQPQELHHKLTQDPQLS